MAQDLWINLPVRDVARAAAFFTQIGFAPNPGPGNSAHSASFLVGEKKIVLMLFAETMFAGFTAHPVADAGQGTEVLAIPTDIAGMSCSWTPRKCRGRRLAAMELVCTKDLGNFDVMELRRRRASEPGPKRTRC